MIPPAGKRGKERGKYSDLLVGGGGGVKLLFVSYCEILIFRVVTSFFGNRTEGPNELGKLLTFWGLLEKLKTLKMRNRADIFFLILLQS